MLTDLTSHKHSRAARDELIASADRADLPEELAAVLRERGLSGQSAHISAQAAMRNVPGYDPRAALTRILDVETHRGFDSYWDGVFRRMWFETGAKTIPVREYFDIMSEAARRNPHFSANEAASMIELLRDELYVQHALRDADRLRLPHSR